MSKLKPQFSWSVISSDEDSTDFLEIASFVSNGRFSGENRFYTSTTKLLELANGLEALPLEKKTQRFVTGFTDNNSNDVNLFSAEFYLGSPQGDIYIDILIRHEDLMISNLSTDERKNLRLDDQFVRLLVKTFPQELLDFNTEPRLNL